MVNNSFEILKKSIVVDGLFHTLLNDPPPSSSENDIIDMLLKGGVTAINATVLMDYYKNDLLSYLKELYRYFILEEACPEKVMILKKYEDLIRAKNEGKLGVILSMQGADSLEHDLRYVTILHKLGVRLIQITYNQRNNLGCGVFEPHDTGLSRFGQQVIYEMNRLGIVVDLSHVGYQTSLDAIELSKDPVVFSHSGVSALCKHPRNLSDEQIRATAAKGGVIGLCPHSVMNINNPDVRPTVDEFINQIEYIINLVGEDHVGIGSDRWMRPTLAYKMLRVEFERTLPGFFGTFTGDEKHVQGFNYYDEWENLIENLLRRGFNSSTIEKIIGGNFCRIFERVWKE